MDYEDQSGNGNADTYDLAPHSKHNMTSPFGRFVERTSYSDIIIISLAVLIVSSLWFRFAPNGHGLEKEGDCFFSCLYFSLVSFTSLGYGDLLPVGAGRAVALLDVLSGLALTALFIGKFASERQSSILLLIHTSDTQRRIASFSKEISNLRDCIKSKTDARDLSGLNDLLDTHIALNKAIKNYLMFNAHQASIIEFGNFTALIGLYDELKLAFEALSRLHKDSSKFGNIATMRLTYTNIRFFNQIVTRMGNLHEKPKSRGPLWRTALEKLHILNPVSPSTAEQSAKSRLDKLSKSINEYVAGANIWIEKGYHPIQLERVYKAFPAGPRNAWQTGIHKVIANDLHISNSVVTYCITELLKQRRLPK